MKLNGWSMGVMGMAAGVAITLAAPADAKAQQATVRAYGRLQPGPANSDTGIWYFKSGGEEVKIETKEGKIVHAERNGKEVPADRVRFDEDGVKILDDKGGTVFEMSTPAPSVTAPSVTIGGNTLGRFYNGTRSIGPGANAWLFNSTTPEAIEPPNVMMGVTMAEPEYGLRKHCGLEQRAGTMINEVYKGLPAAKAGLEPYDVITEADGQSPATPDVVRSILRKKSAGDEISMTILHKCEPKKVTVKLEAYDADQLEKARQEQMKAAGIDPPVFDLFASQGQEEDWAGHLKGLIARIPNLDNQAIQLVQPGADSAEMQRQITETMKRLSESRSTSEEKVKRVEERLDRLERLLEILVEQKNPGAAKPVPPAPPAIPKSSI